MTHIPVGCTVEDCTAAGYTPADCIAGSGAVEAAEEDSMALSQALGEEGEDSTAGNHALETAEHGAAESGCPEAAEHTAESRGPEVAGDSTVAGSAAAVARSSETVDAANWV